jgi:hypothetical protein
MGTIKYVNESIISDTLCICFEYISHKYLKYKSCHVLELRDKTNAFFFNGINGLTTNFQETVNYLNKYISDHSITKVYLLGACQGSFPALMFGSYLACIAVFTFATIFSIDEDDVMKINDVRLLNAPGYREMLQSYQLKMNFFVHWKPDVQYYVFSCSGCADCAGQLTLLDHYDFHEKVQLNVYDNDVHCSDIMHFQNCVLSIIH